MTNLIKPLASPSEALSPEQELTLPKSLMLPLPERIYSWEGNHVITLPLNSKPSLMNHPLVEVMSYQQNRQTTGLPSMLHYPISEMIQNSIIPNTIVGAGVAALRDDVLRKAIFKITGQHMPAICFVNYLAEYQLYSHLFLHDNNKKRNRQYQSIAFARTPDSTYGKTAELIAHPETAVVLMGSATAEPFIELLWQIFGSRHPQAKESAGSIKSTHPNIAVRSKGFF